MNNLNKKVLLKTDKKINTDPKNLNFQILKSKVDNLELYTITFEGGEDLCSIPTLVTPKGNIVFPGWITLLKPDLKNNNSLNIDNIPSGKTIATFVKEDNTPGNFRYIVLDSNICAVELYYSSYFPLKISLLDKDFKLIKEVESPKNWSKENGYNNFSNLKINVDHNVASVIKIEGLAGYIAIDDLTLYYNLTEPTSSKDNSNDTFSEDNSFENKTNPNNASNKFSEFDRLFLGLSIYLLFFHDNKIQKRY